MELVLWISIEIENRLKEDLLLLGVELSSELEADWLEVEAAMVVCWSVTVDSTTNVVE